MRILTSFVTCAALLITVGLTGCAPDPDDVFDTLLTTATTQTTLGDGDGDDTTGGDGDGDTTTGDGDGDATGDGDGDACGTGMIGEACDDTCPCADGLTCDNTGFCSLGGGDGDGDGDGDPGGDCNTWEPDPMMCPMESLVGVMGIEGNFCGCPCASDADCPMAPPGTQGACALVLGGGMAPTNCGLICSVMNDACPAGSTCKTIGQMDPDLGLCTFP